MEIRTRTDLYKLLPVRPAVVEVGVAEGLFAMDMYRWDPSHLYLVDLWESHNEFPGDAGSPQKWHNANYNNVFKNLGDKPGVKILRGPSVGMAQRCPDDFFDLVYIDACHSYECVMNDLKAWFPKVKKGGLVAGHDYLNNDYGVREAVMSFVTNNGLGSYLVHTIPENRNLDASFYFQKPC